MALLLNSVCLYRSFSSNMVYADCAVQYLNFISSLVYALTLTHYYQYSNHRLSLINCNNNYLIIISKRTRFYLFDFRLCCVIDGTIIFITISLACLAHVLDTSITLLLLVSYVYAVSQTRRPTLCLRHTGLRCVLHTSIIYYFQLLLFFISSCCVLDTSITLASYVYVIYVLDMCLLKLIFLQRK